MKKLLLLVILAVVICVWFTDYVKSGKLQNYIDSNSSKEWAPKVQYYLGFTYYLAAKYDKAEYCFRHLLELYPKSAYAPDSLYQTGVICEETSRPQEAREIYKKILDEFPEFNKIEFVKKKYSHLLNF